MTLRSPTAAMVWELWRVTRVEAAWRLALGIGASLAALMLFAAIAPENDPKKSQAVNGFGAAVALALLALPHFPGWISLAKHTGTGLGFPFGRLYTRPVRTAVIVGLPMAWLVAVPVAIYLLSALLLKAVSGYPVPLLPVAGWIAALVAASLATGWSTRNRPVALLPSMVFGGSWTLFAIHRLTSWPDGQDWYDSPTLWPSIFNLPFTDYALMASIVIASFAVAVIGVARQRRGDAGAASWAPGKGWPEWLLGLFRLPCPTSSATRAQVWFEMRSSGLPLLATALALALLTPLLFALSGPVDATLFGGLLVLRPLAAMFAGLSLVGVLVLGGNLFGIRGSQERLGPFQSTQAFETSSLTGLKVLVRSACKLVALTIVGASAWASVVFLPPLRDGKPLLHIGGVPLNEWMRGIGYVLETLTVYEWLALAALAVTWLLACVAGFAALRALWVRYFRRVNIAASLLLIYVLVLAVLPLAERSGLASAVLVDTLFAATNWIAAAAVIGAVARLFWSGFAERVLTVRYACGVLAISAAFWAAWATLLAKASVTLSEMPASNVASMLTLLLLPLLASVLAPWSFSRIRHR
jgi:hypothetical protein